MEVIVIEVISSCSELRRHKLKDEPSRNFVESNKKFIQRYQRFERYQLSNFIDIPLSSYRFQHQTITIQICPHVTKTISIKFLLLFARPPKEGNPGECISPGPSLWVAWGKYFYIAHTYHMKLDRTVLITTKLAKLNPE